jgi:sugar phosphate isomerase/epimerase
MNILLSSGSLYTLPLAKAFQIASEAGYDGMEVIISESFAKGEDDGDLKRGSEALSLTPMETPVTIGSPSRWS